MAEKNTLHYITITHKTKLSKIPRKLPENALEMA